MTVYLLDTSALLKRYLQEQGSDVMDRIFGKYTSARYVSGICLLECFSNIQRLYTVDGFLTQEQHRQLCAAVMSDIQAGRMVITNTTAVEIDRAVDFLISEYLAAVDVLQLAIAIVMGPETVLVSSDKKLNKMATKHGIQVLNPAEGVF